MTGRFCLLFLLGTTLSTGSGTTVPEKVEIVSATARTFYPQSIFKAEYAFDGNSASSYASDNSQPNQWLKLELKEPTLVGDIVVINRFVDQAN